MERIIADASSSDAAPPPNPPHPLPLRNGSVSRQSLNASSIRASTGGDRTRSKLHCSFHALKRPGMGSALSIVLRSASVTMVPPSPTLTYFLVLVLRVITALFHTTPDEVN